MEDPGRRITVPLDQVVADFGNVRFEAPTPESVAALAGSIREDGLLHPPVVRPHPADDGRYQLVIGHRRLAALAIIDVRQIEVDLWPEISDHQARRMQLAENLGRQDLSPVEKAQAMDNIIGAERISRSKLAASLGVSRSEVTKSLSLLTLPAGVRLWVHRDKLSASHGELLARRLKGEPEAQTELAGRAVREALDVRTLGVYVGEWIDGRAAGEAGPGEALPEYRYQALPPTPATVLNLLPGRLPPEGEEASAGAEQREFSMRIGLYAKLCAFGDHELRARILDLPVPISPENAQEVMDFVFRLPLQEAQALDMRLNRRYIEAGHRARRTPPRFALDHMDTEVSDPEIARLLEDWRSSRTGAIQEDDAQDESAGTSVA